MLILVQPPQHKSTPDPVAALKNIKVGAIFIEIGDIKKCCTFSGHNLVPKRRKKIHGALSSMHKGPKYIQSLWDHPKKIPFVQKHKESAICVILREKHHFVAFPEPKKGVVKCAMLRRGLLIMQIPRGYQKKSLLCRKSAILSIRFKFQF